MLELARQDYSLKDMASKMEISVDRARQCLAKTTRLIANFLDNNNNAELIRINEVLKGIGYDERVAFKDNQIALTDGTFVIEIRIHKKTFNEMMHWEDEKYVE